jgi:ATP-binding cassette subfamily C protein EexD
VITHRPSVLAHVDKLLVLNNGELAMYGPLKQVWAKLQNTQQAAASAEPTSVQR